MTIVRKGGSSMKWLGIMGLAGLLATLPVYVGAQSQRQAGPATQVKGAEMKAKPAGPAKCVPSEERRAFEKKTAADLERINKQIADLRVKGTNVVPQQKRQSLKMMQGLYQQAIGARAQLTNLEKAPEQAWSEGRDGMSKTMQVLQKSLAEVEEQFK